MKKAFTLPELLIVLTLMGVIGAFAMRSFKPNEMKYKHLISNLYYHLDQAIYNGAADGCDPFSVIKQENCIDAIKQTTSVATNEIGNSKVLCQALVNYINTTGVDCSSASLAVGDVDLGKKTPHIKTANGIWLYLVAANGAPFVVDGYNGEKYKYYLIYADLTGKKPPNTMSYGGLSSKSLPDSYTFAVIDSNRVIPLGPLEVDKRLMTARVAFTPSDTNDVEYTKVATSYIDAQKGAWDYHPNQEATPENPHSFNKLIREKLPSGHPAKSGITFSPSSGVTVLSDSVHNCAAKFIENCFIVVDKYLF